MPPRRHGVRLDSPLLTRRFSGGQQVPQFLTDQEFDRTGLDECLGILVRRSRPDNDGHIGGGLFPVCLRGPSMRQINDRFLPAAGFKNHRPPGVDRAHPKTHFHFVRLAGFHPELPLLQHLGDGLIEMSGGLAEETLEGIVRRRTAFFYALRLVARENHCGGKAAALAVADEMAAGAPSDEGNAIQGAPAAEAKPDQLPGFNAAQDRG